MSHPPASDPAVPAPPPLPVAETEGPLTDAQALDLLLNNRAELHRRLSQVIVGQGDVIEHILLCLLAGGHCLITGAPGLAKTLLVKSIARIFALDFQRIQFTPDLMPADITGTEILQETAEGRRLTFVPGPIFANLVLADEINRTPPKTQAALLEAMQEHQVTAMGQRHALREPFFVLATQNPVEMEGTYPLPEAQLDRFLFNVVVDYLPEAEEVQVLLRTTGDRQPAIEPLFTREQVLHFQKLVRQVPVAEEVATYAVRLAAASRPRQPAAADFVNDWVSWGAGTRAGQALLLGAKARALWNGRAHVSLEDVKALAEPALRHRILLNYRAEADGVKIEDLIARLTAAVKPV